MRALALLAALTTSPALAAPCGGPFGAFLGAMKTEATNLSRAEADRFFDRLSQDQKVLQADRRQGVFRKPFTEFARSLISRNRLENGLANAKKHANIFALAEKDYGIPAGILLAFWGFETDYGAFQGDYNTANALATLAHDCRRPELFQPQLLAAATLWQRGEFDPATTTGAWAGEIGMVQMLPSDIRAHGVDGDGDGKVSLKTSAADALLSGARVLQGLGWQAGQPWLQEITLPADFAWQDTGLRTTRPASEWAAMGAQPRAGQFADLPASIILPEGRKGPTFITYPNFSVLFEWNQSFVYVTTAAYFANRLMGAPVFNAGNPDPQLSLEETKTLQQKLQSRGYDVGGIDGILGTNTRDAVRKEQQRLGLPADAWPTRALLEAL
ncbi:lytic murein transglycosylase (plasmid) [Pseudorhodobacter turbinis]|uniref:Lytic murein transglycosylase n=1 Tax=Pseudorhodobacter turbinis TaxID=2500533 RepID=A0A4P8EMB8_9RHOB|nr:lytic murein transglycosylase [Pseudorhodobacter turbinis]QCO58042.1 lytic murein transglycosylase [Pseudorhodobacter turbinis]